MSTARVFLKPRMWDLEPETYNTLALMSSQPSSIFISRYDNCIKDIKRSCGLRLNRENLNTLFNYIYFRSSHSKETSLLNWAKNAHHGTEIGTIRFSPFQGVGGVSATNSYINNNFNQLQDIFSLNTKVGGWVSSDFTGSVVGFRDTRTGLGASETYLTPNGSNRIYQSWGATGRSFIRSGEGMREVALVSSGYTYDIFPNSGVFDDTFDDTFGGDEAEKITITGIRELRFNGQIDIISSWTEAFRNDFEINWYSLARNHSVSGTLNGTPNAVNNAGWCKFEFCGSSNINSVGVYRAVKKYLGI